MVEGNNNKCRTSAGYLTPSASDSSSATSYYSFQQLGSPSTIPEYNSPPDEVEDSSEDVRCHDVYGVEDYSEDEVYIRAPKEPAPRSNIDMLTKKFVNMMKMIFRKPKRIHESQFYGVLVDGYYRNHLPNGGFGVVIIDRTGAPVVALSGVSEYAVSELHHTLEGIQAGLRLAEKYGITKVHVACNNDEVTHLVSWCFKSNRDGCFNAEDGLPLHNDFDMFCVTCCTGERKLHHEVLKDIVMVGARYDVYGEVISKIYKRSNRAADFLAKCGETKEYQPHELPRQARQYLSQDGVPRYIKPWFVLVRQHNHL